MSMHLLSLGEAAMRIRQGEIKSEDYAAALLRRCRQGNALNAFISIDAEALLSAARDADLARARGRIAGPLHGVPLAIKDNINTRQLPTTGGTDALALFRPKCNAAIVDRLVAQGALVLGKNNMHELAMGWTNNNPHFGRVGNPHAPSRLAGGSSGGSACAVAAFMAPGAIATDTNGSIRIPASLCGVAGLRPSSGRYPTEGVLPLAPSLDTVGPIARNAADLALLDSVMSGLPQNASQCGPGVRIGISPAYFHSDLDPQVMEVMRDYRLRLEDQGVAFIEADIAGIEDLAAGTAPALIRYEAARTLPRYLATYAPGVTMDQLVDSLGADLVEAFAPPADQGDEGRELVQYQAAQQRRTRLREVLQAYFATHRVDAIMHPVLRIPAPVMQRERVSPAPDVRRADGSVMSARLAFGQNVSPASLAGMPGLVLTAGRTPQGLPVGVEFDAPEGHDGRLLALGQWLEAAVAAGSQDLDIATEVWA